MEDSQRCHERELWLSALFAALLLFSSCFASKCKFCVMSITVAGVGRLHFSLRLDLANAIQPTSNSSFPSSHGLLLLLLLLLWVLMLLLSMRFVGFSAENLNIVSLACTMLISAKQPPNPKANWESCLYTCKHVSLCVCMCVCVYDTFIGGGNSCNHHDEIIIRHQPGAHVAHPVVICTLPCIHLDETRVETL